MITRRLGRPLRPRKRRSTLRARDGAQDIAPRNGSAIAAPPTPRRKVRRSMRLFFIRALLGSSWGSRYLHPRCNCSAVAECVGLRQRDEQLRNLEATVRELLLERIERAGVRAGLRAPVGE